MAFCRETITARVAEKQEHGQISFFFFFLEARDHSVKSMTIVFI